MEGVPRKVGRTNTILVGKYEGNTSFCRPRHRYEVRLKSNETSAINFFINN